MWHASLEAIVFLCDQCRDWKLENKRLLCSKVEQQDIRRSPALSSQLLIFPQGRVAPQVFRRTDGKDLGSLKKSGGGSIVVVSLDAKVFHGPATDPRKGGIGSSDPKTLEMVAGYGRGNALVVAKTMSYMLTDDQIIASDLVSRKVIWKADSDCSHALVATKDALFAGGTDRVSAFTIRDGRRLWTHAIDGKAFGLAIANGRLIVSTDVGAIYAFRPGVLKVAAKTESKAAPLADQDSDVEPVRPFRNDALMGRWVFQKSAIQGNTFKDQSGTLNGTVAAPMRFETVGSRQALIFDGSKQSVLLATNHRKVKIPKKTLSAEAWVRVDRPMAWGGLIGAIQDNGSYEHGWLLGFIDSKFSLAVSGKEGSGKLTYLKAKSDFVVGRWYHVAGTYDGQTMRLYVNGKLESESKTEKGDIDYPPQAYYEIGAYHDKDEYFRLNGRILEVRVYGDVLTANEIAEHYKQDSGAFPAAPKTTKLAAGPWLQFTQPGEAIVRWQTKEESPSLLDLKLDGNTVRVAETKPTKNHEVTLTGLKHKRVYSYVIHTINEGKLAATKNYECDTFFDYNRSLLPVPIRAASDQPKKNSNDVIDAIVSHSAVDRGICLVLGSGDGQLASLLAKRTRLRVIGVETDARLVKQSRRTLKRSGLYGQVTIHHVDDLGNLPFVGHFANLVVLQSASLDAGLFSTPKEVLRVLRPNGGVAVIGLATRTDKPSSRDILNHWFDNLASLKPKVIERNGYLWATITRGPLPGAGQWTHLYGRADNSAYGGEQLAGVSKSDDLEVQWVGRPGPRYQADRNGRKPSPLAISGRLFLQGLHRIVAVDSFNGSILWSLEIPDLERFNMPRDCGNWCADAKNIYVAIRDRCWKIDAVTGTVANMFAAEPGERSDWKYDWGYLASEGDKLIGTAVKQGSSWNEFWGGANAGWYDARSGAVTYKICSDNLFGLDKKSGETRWTYSNGVIINPSVTVSNGVIYFVESRNPKVRESNDRRVGSPELWKDQFIVAIDANDGSLLWEKPIDTEDGIVVFYMAHAKDRLVVVSSNNKKYDVYSYSAKNGARQWHQSFGWPGGKGDHGKAMSRPAIVGNRVYVRPQAFALEDGKILDIKMPGGGCGTYACTADALFFRASTVTVWDQKKGKSTTWPRLRPDCWLSTIPADGMLLSPEGGGGCSCGTWMETSIGFIPRAHK